MMDFITPEHAVQNAALSALRVKSIKSVALRHHASGIRGVAYDGLTGIEFDVGHEYPHGWWASDDDGVRHYGDTIEAALERGIEANSR